ncbi:ribosomal protein S5 domain 2-type protein [Syncephalis pseudoplumigaleata]|uniref:Ribosomal protein S5 domain 2-type protein n=1 Tax=Syncephalis pseudoplumigaleata TaxID=1712513 RepID=A0A4P9Z525_9FUNG|nr:ribosomal protein S5 domain 2-type protein [Syncephalis pseudoplumigaleata]|eukprot:RKP27693.1 ribosomal protein S5 domain 2-type protein [Syncephalis pseudoplumigaleata]
MDRRRVQGPETSVVPLPTQEALAKRAALPAPVQDGKRADGRGPEDIRPIFLRTGLISQASGSAYIELGQTKVACAVYGPRQLKKQQGFSEQGRLYCEFKFATFACKKRRHPIRDPQEKEFSQIIVQALAPSIRLDRLPKSVIDLYVTVIENDGTASCLAAAITAASVALADAGVEMLDLVAATSLGYVHQQLLVDCSAAEEAYQQHTDLILAYMPSLGQVTHLLHRGPVDWPPMAAVGGACCVHVYLLLMMHAQ